MRTGPAKRQRSEGSILLVALGITLLLGLGLASYLMLVRSQNLSVARSHAWNAALAMAEAGVEEAMAQLNPSALLYQTNLNRAANGWTFAAGVYRAPRRNLQDGHYDTWITDDAMPVIYSTGYVRAPLFTEPVKRAVRVTTTTDRLFLAGMVARFDIDFKGFRVETDSFNSRDSTYSTGGLYDPAKRKDNGDVASTMGLLNVGNAKVMGNLRTGPEGDIRVGAQGSVGDLAWVGGGSLGLQPGHYKNDFNVDLPDVGTPFTSGFSPVSQTLGGTNFYWVLGSGDYIDSTPGGTRIPNNAIVLVTSRARLYATGDFTMVGSAQIQIAPGASLELYVGGASATISKVNTTGSCASFSYYGLPGNLAISITGNDAFLGSLYAPNATLYMGGGGSDVIDFQGACVLKSIKLNGHFRFHFDEDLKEKGPLRGFVATSWREL